MILDELLNKPLPAIPDELHTQLDTPNRITLTAFSDKDSILCDPRLHSEAGFRRFSEGSYLVSMYCPMPGITAEMIKWWFWWHPQEKKRYQVWYPGEHISNSYHRKDKDYFQQSRCPAFLPNTHFPIERIAGVPMPLRIDFVTPEQFGFSRASMEENQVPLIVCGHVGAFRGLIPHTEMAHIFRQTDEGLWMCSRFWIGETLTNPLLRKKILTDDTAKGMAEHCCVEYRSLAQILPALYDAFA